MNTLIYPKFYGPYIRNKETKKLDKELPRPELLPYMNDTTKWWVSEKMDGTNTRIIWDGYKLEVKGRTGGSQLQGYQTELLGDLTQNGNYKFDETFGEKRVIIYGETFGGKIQGNPHNAEPQFQIFDINIDGVWLMYDDVKLISEQLGLRYVEHELLPNWRAVLERFEQTGRQRQDNGAYYEGLVAVPEHMPLTRTGERVITKVKMADF
ncbi:RNA ligase family protein [Weissella ceti]|uniref:RNA ligase family protein n=1 Tax=Weissella ceti TaxID=759620 RepID=A0ABT3E4B8_9LACO|nr:RNA ligase family protein [Weissella ceti]MCW0953264.1 RNA ligase family protein [Weissella ceti]QVK11374.1 hypothetical protein KHQ31_03895 [Weissella ceti]